MNNRTAGHGSSSTLVIALKHPNVLLTMSQRIMHCTAISTLHMMLTMSQRSVGLNRIVHNACWTSIFILNTMYYVWHCHSDTIVFCGKAHCAIVQPSIHTRQIKKAHSPSPSGIRTWSNATHGLCSTLCTQHKCTVHPMQEWTLANEIAH